MKVIEPENGRELTIASYAWTPGTKGKVIGDVVIVKAKKKEDGSYKEEARERRGPHCSSFKCCTCPRSQRKSNDTSYP